MEKNTFIVGAIILSIVFLITSCSSPQEKRAVTLNETHCASCNLLPAIEDLPKFTWENGVLPDMAARMGINDNTNDPYQGLSFDEQYAIIQTGTYPDTPFLSTKDWKLLKNYMVSMAPDSLISDIDSRRHSELTQFVPRPVKLDSTAGTFITFLEYDEQDNRIITADLNGNLLGHDIESGVNDTLMQTCEAITSYTKKNGSTYITHTGYLIPSEIARGNLQIKSKDTIEQMPMGSSQTGKYLAQRSR